jgi:hypothetical protein
MMKPGNTPKPCLPAQLRSSQPAVRQSDMMFDQQAPSATGAHYVILCGQQRH